MKVFLASSFFGKSKYKEAYLALLHTIESTNQQFLSTDKGDYITKLKLQDIAGTKSKKNLHYEAVKRGISWADVVIIEASHEDFQLGLEVNSALSSKKPVLCLSIHEDFSKKITNPYFFASKYNEKNLEKIVTDFINRFSSQKLDHRFNLFLSSRQLTGIEKEAQKLNMNNSEYVRMLIDNSI